MGGLIRSTVSETILERIHRDPEKVAFKSFEDGSWRSRTFAQFEQDAEWLAFGMLALGCLPNDRIALLSNTRYEWTLVDFACMGAQAISVPIYPTVTTKEIGELIRHSGSRIVFVENKTQMRRVLEAIELDSTLLKQLIKIVGMEPHAISFEVHTFEKKHGQKDFVLSSSALMELGRRLQIQSPHQVMENWRGLNPESRLTIAYTSGTTGEPKGVCLTHSNFVSVLEDSTQLFSAHLRDESERTLSFLPYSHIIGRVESYLMFVFGWETWFAPSLDQIVSLLPVVKPTVLFAVPRIFEKAFVQIQNTLDRPDPLSRTVRFILDRSFKWIDRNPRSRSILHPLLKSTLLRGVRNQFGGQLRFAICGGAPLDVQVATFFEQVGILPLEGYGLTETTGPVAMNTPTALKLGTVGKPMPECQVKISEDGEILIRSGKVFKEYWNDPQETAAAFEDGWFKTGDIGAFDSDGYLLVTDRKKDLIITSGGKNVAPQKIEALAKLYPFISHLVAVGDKKSFLGALVTLDRNWVEHFAQENSILHSGWNELVKNPKIFGLVEGAIREINEQLAPFEKLRRFLVLPTELTQENGELTASQKVKRKTVLAHYKTEINQLFQDSGLSD